MCSRENWEKGFKSCLRGCLKYNFDTKLIKEGIKILISSLTYRDETSMLVYADCSVIIVSDPTENGDPKKRALDPSNLIEEISRE